MRAHREGFNAHRWQSSSGLAKRRYGPGLPDLLQDRRLRSVRLEARGGPPPSLPSREPAKRHPAGLPGPRGGASSHQAQSSPSSAQTLDQSGGPAGSPVTAHRAGGPPRVRTSRGSTSPPLSGSMHPANVRGRAKVRKLLLDALPRSLAVRGRRASTDGERRCSPDRVALRTDATLIGKAKAFVPELVVRRDCGGKDGAPAVGTAGALWDRTSCATSATGCGP